MSPLLVLLALLAPAGAQPQAPAVLELRALPLAPASFGAAALGERLYLFGGHVGRTHEHSRDNLSALFLGVAPDGSATELAGGRALQGLALAAHAGRLVRVGGLEAHNARGEPEDLWSTSEVAAFDPAAGAWSELPPLPQGRSSHDAAVLGDLLVVVGGWTLSGPAPGTWATTSLVLDLAAPRPEWRAIEQPFRARALAVATHGGRVYAIGGLGEDGEPVPTVRILDPATGTWTEGPELPEWGMGVAAVEHDGMLLASGRGGTLWRLAGERWEAAGALLVPRIFHRLVSLEDGRLVAVGGAHAGGHVAWIEQLAPGERRGLWSGRLALPTEARQRQGALLLGDELLLFGGNRSAEAHQFEPEDFLDVAVRVDLTTGTAEPAPSLPYRRQSMACATLESDPTVGFAVGGFGHDGEEERAFATVASYARSEDAWRVSPVSLPAPRTQFGLAAHGGALWVFGGLDFLPSREKPFQHLDSILTWRPDDEAGFVTSELRLPRARRAFGGALCGGRYYLVGGMADGFAPVEACDVLDLASGAWSEIPAPHTTRVSPRLVALGERLLLVGGSSSAADGTLSPEPSVELFDPASGTWSMLLAELPLPAEHLHALAWGERLWVGTTAAAPGELAFAVLAPEPHGPG